MDKMNVECRWHRDKLEIQHAEYFMVSEPLGRLGGMEGGFLLHGNKRITRCVSITSRHVQTLNLEMETAKY